MKARLLILAATVFVVLNFSGVGLAEEVTHPSAAPEEMKQGDEKKGEAEKAQRPDIRKVKEDSAEKNQDNQREKAYQESRDARVKKLERTRGQKVKSWQVLNR
jgi:hypothetical protein